MSDQEVLALFFRDAKGSQWSRNDNWLSNARYGKWFGIVADEGGHVKDINLNDNCLKGFIHDSPLLALFIGLQTLNLPCNYLSSSIPVHIGLIKSLRQLNLSWNNLVGEIPESLFELSELVILRIDNNCLSGMLSPSLTNLQNLQFLNVSNNKLSGQ
jgi:hypothetical protein